MPTNWRTNSKVLSEDEQLKAHLIECDGSPMEMFFPFYQSGNQHLLSKRQRQRVYMCVRATVIRTEEAKFRQKQRSDFRHYRDERTLLFYDIIATYPDWKKNGPGIIVRNYQQNFFNYEALLQLRRLGIEPEQLDFIDGGYGERRVPTNVRLLSQRKAVAFMVEYFAYHRWLLNHPDGDYYDFHIYKYGEEPVDVKVHRFYVRCDIIHELVSLSGVKHEQIFTFTKWARDLGSYG